MCFDGSFGISGWASEPASLTPRRAFMTFLRLKQFCFPSTCCAPTAYVNVSTWLQNILKDMVQAKRTMTSSRWLHCGQPSIVFLLRCALVAPRTANYEQVGGCIGSWLPSSRPPSLPSPPLSECSLKTFSSCRSPDGGILEAARMPRSRPVC